ncbi:hypothetical protein JK386_10835 [Nocardioides sp. zg-536]|uniref:Uncharacterized protein n=1 Tax=Nocardioides faecalis TaxID=2803858 RepID=A0A938YAR1_9ACTN|nr:hypothetical protein [Nocardioides faecalis]MBM9460399.1 hypothetical protein [Nocardioides faecalis]MBS4751324.1 hypothetical protein [Nocardioides faecalis]QVI59776.1 hypothetical protein KG111_05425 [Nocardioides faecalis]
MSALLVDLALVLAQAGPLVADVVRAAEGESDGIVWLLAAGPVGGAATYWAIYRYYRNTDKSHSFEHETIIEAQPVEGGEEKVDHISRTRKSRIEGDNASSYRRRVNRVR